MRQISAIFLNTLLETARQPVFALIMTLACSLIAILPGMAAHIYTFGAGTKLANPADRMVADLGLSTVLISGLLLAIFSATSVISQEIENKTALTVLSKPVGRGIYVLGKYLGVTAAIGLATLAACEVVLLTVRAGPTVSAGESLDVGVLGAIAFGALLAVAIATFRNYYHGKSWIGSFTLSFISIFTIIFIGFAFFDKAYNFIPLMEDSEKSVAYDWDVAKAAFLTLQSVFIITGIAVAASTRLRAAGNFAITAVFFMGSLTIEYFYGKFNGSIIAKFFNFILPDMQILWMSEALTRERPIPMEYVYNATAYAGLYIMGALFLAAFLFQKREIA